MADFIGYLANIPGAGEHITRYESGFRRDLFKFRLENKDVELKQDGRFFGHGIDTGELRGRFVPTTSAFVRNVSEREVKNTVEMLHDLSFLVSFATFSSVRLYGYEYPAGSGYEHHWASVGAYQRSWPLFADISGASLSGFIQRAWFPYLQMKKQRRLPIVISYLVEAQRPGQPMEIQLLCAFVALENLKDSFARMVGIPFLRGRFRDLSSGMPAEKAPPMSFEKLLYLMLDNQGMRRGVKRIINLRNEIVHSGVSRLSSRSQRVRYVTTVRLIQQYMLHLLEYEGLYHSFGGEIRVARKRKRPSDSGA